MQKTGVQYLTVQADYEGQRIDNFLITRLKGVPKTRIYRLIRKGEVRVNKKRIDPSYRLKEGDEVRLPPVSLTTKEAPRAPSERLTALLKERILFENNQLLIINKPAGMPVHGGTGVKLGIIEALKKMYPKNPHLELAHRLDLDTSGCLILAKKRSVLKELHELLREGRIKKIYHALTRGRWKKDSVTVDVPLKKNQLQSGERIVRVDKEGKASVTHFKVLERFEEATLVEATLETGRTHQIRVHCQYSGHPIVGDEKYGDKEWNKRFREKGLKRLFLHAYSIEFLLSSEKAPIKITAPLDTDLKACLESLTR